MIDNPRFKDNVVVKSQVMVNGIGQTDDNGDPIYNVILTSSCGLRTINEADVNSGIAQTDAKLSLPTPFPMVLVKIGDQVEYTNNTDGEVIEGRVTRYKPNNLGCDLYFHANG